VCAKTATLRLYSLPLIQLAKANPKNKEISSVLQIPIVRTRLTEEGGDVVGSTPEPFAAYTALETETWAKVVKAANVRAE
jgi:tripartite-type tricarboxylate transporter receptor subunit TctC